MKKAIYVIVIILLSLASYKCYKQVIYANNVIKCESVGSGYVINGYSVKCIY